MNGDRMRASNGIEPERRRREFLRSLAVDFARLRGRQEAWHEEIAERSMWDRALKDDLENE